jgi:hypothetical protein
MLMMENTSTRRHTQRQQRRTRYDYEDDDESDGFFDLADATDGFHTCSIIRIPTESVFIVDGIIDVVIEVNVSSKTC